MREDDPSHSMDTFVECEGEEVLLEEDGKVFFRAVTLYRLRISVNDMVRITLDEDDEAGESYAYAHVMAIFDEKGGEGMQLEVRWFFKQAEIDVARKKKFRIQPNEVFESNVVQNIAVVMQHVVPFLGLMSHA